MAMQLVIQVVSMILASLLTCMTDLIQFHSPMFWIGSQNPTHSKGGLLHMLTDSLGNASWSEPAIGSHLCCIYGVRIQIAPDLSK